MGNHFIKMIMGKLLKIVLLIVVCGVLIVANVQEAHAQTSHENPENIQHIFSGIPLFQYYTACLDFTLMKKVDEVESRLEKIPYASVPPELTESNNNLSNSIGEMAHLVSGITDNFTLLRTYIAENRLEEASETANETYKMLSQSIRELRVIEDATEFLGQGFKVAAAPLDSTLRISYEELRQRIKEINDFIDLSKKTLDSLVAQPKLLMNTRLTLTVEPDSVYVGDTFFVEGTLSTSEGITLSDREVLILLGGSKILTVTTDSQGRYQSSGTIPYEYLPVQEVQALYLPQDEDLEKYASSSSLPVEITVLYYQTRIIVDIPEQAYRGLAFNLAGRFDYDGAPLPESRIIELYLDDTLMARDTVGEEFYVNLPLDQSVSLGEHVLTIATPPMMRYSPDVATEYLNVTSLATSLDIEIPGVLIGPSIISEPRTVSIGDTQVALGGLSARGMVWAEVGDLNDVLIEITLGDSRTQIIPDPDGTFDLNVGAAMGFMLFGSQELEIKVLPQEPWHAPLYVTRSILMINVINCSVTLIILVVLGIFLSSRLRKSHGDYQRKKLPVSIKPVPAEVKPVYTVDEVVPFKERTVKSRLLQLYTGIVKLLLKITHTTLKPAQTMREFSWESSSFLGPSAKFFMDFTRLIEKLFYSSYEPSSNDSVTGQELSDSIKKEFKDEVI